MERMSFDIIIITCFCFISRPFFEYMILFVSADALVKTVTVPAAVYYGSGATLMPGVTNLK